MKEVMKLTMKLSILENDRISLLVCSPLGSFSAYHGTWEPINYFVHVPKSMQSEFMNRLAISPKSSKFHAQVLAL